MTRRELLATAAAAAAAQPATFSPAFVTASEAAAAVRAKRISSRELTNIAFERIDRYNPKLNAIVLQFREQAMARAKDADDATARGRSTGPLHGVPVTIKEAFAYKGSPNTWGIEALKNVNSPRTAVAVERLESAGAIVIGKTNVPYLLSDWQSYNSIYGTTNNPWDLKRTPGGSTGGGAAALAAGLGHLTLGSDIGGSIRVPAHFCGVYGHKPSLNLVSIEGHEPGPYEGSPAPPSDLAVAGPLARSAQDLELSLRVLGAPDRDAARAWTWSLPAPRQKRLSDFRIGYIMGDQSVPLSSDVAAVYERTLAALRRAGARLDHGWPAGLDVKAQFDTYRYLLFSVLGADISNEEREEYRRRFLKDPRDIIAAAAVAPHSRWLGETQNRLRFRALWQQYFDTHDVFLMPVAFTAAFPHDHSARDTRTIDTPEGKRPYMDLLYWIATATLTGLPATVAPLGLTRSGLPAGLQIIGPMWEDATPIQFAGELEKIAGGFIAPPGYAT